MEMQFYRIEFCKFWNFLEPALSINTKVKMIIFYEYLFI